MGNIENVLFLFSDFFFNWYCSLNIFIVVIWVKLDNIFNKFEINNNDV